MGDQIQSAGASYGSQSVYQSQYQTQTLSDDQKKTLSSILKNYDPTKLTSSDAKAIFQSLQQAGIQPSKDLTDTLKTAGFDPQKMRQLAGGGRHHHHHQDAAAVSSSTGSSSQINLSSLQSLQSVLGQYDLNNLSTDQSKKLQSQLTDLGLAQPGSTINLTA